MQNENDDECVRLDTRLAGQLRRYHTWPIIGQQNIAEHCWQILRIYLSVVDVPDTHMIRHIMFHDIGEHFTGDIPYPVKRDNRVLKDQMDMLAMRSYATQLNYWDSFHPVALKDDEKKLFKDIEILEMAEFGMDQYCLGNKHGWIIADRCLRAIYNNQPCARLAKYVSKRLKLFYRQCQAEINSEEDWWYTVNWEKIHVDGKSETDRRNALSG